MVCPKFQLHLVSLSVHTHACHFCLMPLLSGKFSFFLWKLQTHQRRRKNSSQGQGQQQQQQQQPPSQPAQAQIHPTESPIAIQHNSTAPTHRHDTPLVITTGQSTTSLFKCQYCNALFQIHHELQQHEEIHKKLGHIGTVNLLASQNILTNQHSCKFAASPNSHTPRPESNQSNNSNNRQQPQQQQQHPHPQDMKPLICHQCGLLCPSEIAMIEHVKQHETLNKLYQSQQQQQRQQQQQQQQQPQQHQQNQSQQATPPGGTQQQVTSQMRSDVRNERSPQDGGRSSNMAVGSPAPEHTATSAANQHSSSSASAQNVTSSSMTSSTGNMSVFPMPQISPGLPSMLDELCLAASTWNSFYTQQQTTSATSAPPGSSSGNVSSAGLTVPQLPKALTVHSTINQNHLANGGNMVLPPGAAIQQQQHQLQQQQQQLMVIPKPKKKKKKKKPKVNKDDIFECSICHQTFATEFHRNIHANSHKYYDASRSSKATAAAAAFPIATAVTAETNHTAKNSLPNATISSNNANHSSTANNRNKNAATSNPINNTAVSASNNNSNNPSASPAVTGNSTSNNAVATTSGSFNNMSMGDTSGVYVPSSYGMAAVVTSTSTMSTYGMTTVPNAFQTAASLPTMVPMATPNQYPVTMAMGGPGAPHSIFPLLHRPASGALTAPVAHHPVAQQPLFPQPIPQPVFPQR